MERDSNNLRLFTPVAGTCFQVSATDGTTMFNKPVNCASGLSVSGQAVTTASQLNAQKPHAAGVMDSNGAVVRDNGKYAWTASRQSNSFYVVFSTPCATPYGVIATAEHTSSTPITSYTVVTYGDRTANGFTLRAVDVVPASITFMVLSYDFGLG